jgi:hypothetical protein
METPKRMTVATFIVASVTITTLSLGWIKFVKLNNGISDRRPDYATPYISSSSKGKDITSLSRDANDLLILNGADIIDAMHRQGKDPILVSLQSRSLPP